MKFNKKMIIMLASMVGIILVIIILMMLFAGGKSKVLTYEQIEEKILIAGKKYYENNKDKLPENGSTYIEVKTLIVEGYLNDLSGYTNESVICDGKFFVTKNPLDYSYGVELDCGTSYVSKKFKDVVLSEVVTSGNGIYKMEQVNPNNVNDTQSVYVFRGDNVNNYIKVGDYYWRIVKVFENGEMAILGDPDLLNSVWDDRYNIEIKDYVGINDYSISRINEVIARDVVSTKTGFLNIKKLITTHSSCVGKRGLKDTIKDGSVECSEILENQYFSLLPMYDYLNASLDLNCTDLTADSCYNYNYLASSTRRWWTGTAVDFDNYQVYFINNIVDYDDASSVKNARLYVHLQPNVTYVSGTGTYEDPYIVK